MSQPRKKKEKEKIPLGPTCQPPFPFLCFAPRDADARVVAAGVHSRDTCRPSSCSVPPFTPPLALSLSARDRPRSPRQTLALPSIDAAGPSSLLAADFPAPVRAATIPCAGSFISLPVTHSPPHSALSSFLQGPRRAPPPAAASLRRDAASSPLLACITAGEARRLLLFPVRAALGPLWPRPVAPLRAAAARRRRARRVRAHARRERHRGRAPPRVKAPGWP